ncbi:MAG: hypothetical protein KatS3mg117_2458 [Geminicoccaceae bacterium]|jgi:hypothetical protein|nr:MAG: hypothetical protein KatS3mg117_2458 [Geminicoccaceae bacterium]
MSAVSLYEQDFHRWCLDQAAALKKLAAMRANLAVPLDLENLAEEIESLGKSQRRELVSRYQVLLLHLLKWRHEPRRRSRSWRSTIATQRLEIARLLRQNPSLRARRVEELADAYEGARTLAAIETGSPLSTFPETCPFTLDQIEDPEFLP